MSSGAVRAADTMACAATWPPKTRCIWVCGCLPRNRFRSIVSRSSRSTSSAAEAGTCRSSSSVLVGVQAGEEPLELVAELLGGRQRAFLGQRQPAALAAPGERVVLLLQAGHDVAHVGGVGDLLGDLPLAAGGRALQVVELPLQAGDDLGGLEDLDRGGG